ncbi:MAG: FtsX-like permease family protein [Bacteroidota bacterium]|nr:FtsX-like permease family protein [Bacteroidota bacterium]
MLALKLAYRNLIGAGLRTWLIVFVLSLSFVVIIWHKGMLDGWDAQATTDLIAWEYGGGQLWNKNYDPFDPFTLEESHSKIPDAFKKHIKSGNITPILITQGTIYPEGRMQSILIKGIDKNQDILKIPTDKFLIEDGFIPAVIGTKMAKSNDFKIGDNVMLRWRDVNGTFDATNIKITGIFKTNAPTVDNSQIWIPIESLQEMMKGKNEATIFVQKEPMESMQTENWIYKSQKFLLTDITELIKMKSVGGAVFYGILLLLALLAIFDTQILSIFRRQKEIGTYVAMGMTKSQVVGLFTVEGAFHSVLALIMGAIYGIPFLSWQAKTGITMPMEGDDYGLPMAEIMYPKYGVSLVITTILIVMIATTIVSYWPSRKISKMKPTEALRGKVQ